jgi:NitT/TauT family transport system substrate-binding protein
MTATTAQLPLLAALKAGWPEGAEVKVEYWKNLEDLRALVLAGKGDVWVGHLETLSRAAARGAPACLVAVTVWRKFYFVSAPLPTRNGPNRATAYPADVTELLGVAAKNSITVTSSPQNSPQANLLEELKGAIGAFPTDSLPPQQLILELVRGQRQIALMPEPMASMAVSKSPNLKIIGSLEEEYSKHFGGDGLMPQAGVAVNLELASSQPGLVADLLAHMLKAATDLEGKPVSAKVALFPPEVAQAVGPEVLSASLSLEPLIVKAASEVKDQVTDFLILAAPDLFEPGKAFPPNFYWDMAGSQGQPGSPASDAR